MSFWHLAPHKQLSVQLTFFIAFQPRRETTSMKRQHAKNPTIRGRTHDTYQLDHTNKGGCRTNSVFSATQIFHSVSTEEGTQSMKRQHAKNPTIRGRTHDTYQIDHTNKGGLGAISNGCPWAGGPGKCGPMTGI